MLWPVELMPPCKAAVAHWCDVGLSDDAAVPSSSVALSAVRRPGPRQQPHPYAHYRSLGGRNGHFDFPRAVTTTGRAGDRNSPQCQAISPPRSGRRPCEMDASDAKLRWRRRMDAARELQRDRARRRHNPGRLHPLKGHVAATPSAMPELPDTILEAAASSACRASHRP